MKQGLRRRLAVGTNAMLVAGLLIATIILLVGLAGRYRVRWDLSEDAASTLQPETSAILEALDAQEAQVRVIAFSAQRKNEEALHRDRTMKDLLRELSFRSTHLETKFVDFDADRLTANALGVSAYGTVVIEGRGDRIDLRERDVFKRTKDKDGARSLAFYGEPLIAKGIRQVLSDEPRTVYLLEGHGEAGLVQHGPGGLQVLVQLLENQGWTVSNLNLLQDRETEEAPFVPTDASAVL